MAKNWLEKYNDGGPVQPNYNDAQASTGPGYTGTGYDTTGRNYSPAWGGQFQNGGFLQKAKSFPVIEDIEKINEYGLKVPDWEAMTKQAKQLGAKQVRTKHGATIIFDNNWEVTGATDPDPELAKLQMGGSMPGAVGFTYARTAGAAPDNGKYAKKTKASAQNGKEMSFYQNGLDWKPNNISKNGSVIKDDRGQWAYPGEITEINSNNITMEGVDYPVLGVSDTGDTKFMQPGQDYKFKGNKVIEYPQAQNGWLGKYDNNASDATRVAPKMIPLSEEEKRQNLIKQSEQNKRDLEYNKKVIAERQKARDTKGSVAEHNFTTGEKFRVFPNSVGGAGEVFDDYINPAKIVADRASSLGNSRTPLEALGSVATTAGFGTLGFDPLGNAIAAKGLVNPALEAAGKYLTEETALKNAYDINPLAEKLKNPKMAYRIGDEASYQDYKNSGFIRPKSLTPEFQNKTFDNFTEAIADRPTSFPSFAKGEPAWDYLPQEGKGYIYATEQPVVRRGDINPITGQQVRGRHWAYRPIDEKTGKVITELPADKVKVYSSEPHWLKGYQEVPKPKSPEELIDLYRIQEKGAKTFAERAAEGNIPKYFNTPEVLARKAEEEKYFGQWFTNDKNDLDWYKGDREFDNPEIINLKIPKSKISQYQNYDKTLSRAPDREFVIPHDEQKLYKKKNGGWLNKYK